jgi:uroporphyrin-III C-methyltransferase
LIKGGRRADEPVGIVTSATTSAQKVLETTLAQAEADIAASTLEAPAIICVGQAVTLRQALDWQAMASGAAPRNLDPLNRGRPAESA